MDLREKLAPAAATGGMEGAGDPTVVDGVAACSHFSVSSLMLVEPPGDLPQLLAFLPSPPPPVVVCPPDTAPPMGSSLGRSFELVLEYFLSGVVAAGDHLGLSADGDCSATMLERLEEPESAAAAASGTAATSALELRRLLQLNDLTVEAMLS